MATFKRTTGCSKSRYNPLAGKSKILNKLIRNAIYINMYIYTRKYIYCILYIYYIYLSTGSSKCVREFICVCVCVELNIFAIVCVRCAFQLEEIDILISSCAFLQKITARGSRSLLRVSACVCVCVCVRVCVCL